MSRPALAIVALLSLCPAALARVPGGPPPPETMGTRNLLVACPLRAATEAS